jgi:hypothetical protein
MPIQVTVEATNIEGRRSNPTALELAAALTFTHRLINKAFKERFEGRDFGEYGESTLGAEPALVNFNIAEVRNGSVLLNGIIEAAQTPFVQGVAGGIIANIITPGIVAIAQRTKAVFRRPSRASAGRTLTVTIRSERLVLHTHCRYEEHRRTEITIREEGQ